ncbi:Os08g0228900 [Oryza sativa Japonica Group]|uniref:Uncharacterized protein n=2 Tax=Oryza sativa subsp. japonica TaxID=39947 RepID=A3BQV2_ORYSJ|nr:hypothetical protein OsJ_26486 [Oryza sativa Japonica Group]KAF2918667.1 hypothetical protein DAI22_08g074000 [Oryza sativa Japonica Group]BAD01398.1 hypothetical protein [Oryza sativa Japonica Group]BAD03741.1 hypothetical protein [Oryza sativa Japonica Group]BAT04418.1 Os08g0228900 [Oryza sativa Japonica Group]
METKEGATTTLMPAAKAFAGAGGGGDNVEKKPPVVSKKVPMPQVLLDYILSWTRMGPWPSSDDHSEFLLSPEHRNQDDDDGFAAFEAKVRAQREELSAFLDKKDDEFAVFQAKVRDEVDENGCYMVDGTYFADLEAAQALSNELFAKLNMSGILFEED